MARLGPSFAAYELGEDKLFAHIKPLKARDRWNREEAQFTALPYFALYYAHRATRKEQVGMIRRYIIWRNHHAYNQRLRHLVAPSEPCLMRQ